MKILKLYGSFLWIRLNYLKATESMPGDSFFFTTQSPRVSGTHLTNFSRMEGKNNLYLEATQQIWIHGPGLGIKRLTIRIIEKTYF